METTTKAAHTPLPWHRAYYATTNAGGGSHFSIKHGEKTILRTYSAVADDEDEANVNLSLRAVNSRGVLLNTLQSFVDLAPEILEFVGADTAEMYRDLVKAARAAIAKATGETS